MIFPKIFSKNLKNLLIFVPAIISVKEIDFFLLKNIFIGFIIFCLISFVIYLTNDYSDKEIDKLNILKKKKINKNQTFLFIFVINLVLITFLIVLKDTIFFSKYLIIYMINFYIYNFFFKKIKFLDLICLNIFYLTRLSYGSDLILVEISLWFFLFFASLFLILSIFKRKIQISVNRLKKKNKIISYDEKDSKFLRNISILSIIFSLVIFLLFGLKSFFPITDFLSKNETLNIEIHYFLVVYLIYAYNISRLFKLTFKNKINIDIFYFVIKDRIIIFSTFMTLIILLINKL